MHGSGRGAQPYKRHSKFLLAVGWTDKFLALFSFFLGKHVLANTIDERRKCSFVNVAVQLEKLVFFFEGLLCKAYQIFLHMLNPET